MIDVCLRIAMDNVDGNYPPSYGSFVAVEEWEDMQDIKPVIVGGVLRPNSNWMPTPVTLYNFEPPPPPPPPPLRPSPNLRRPTEDHQIPCCSSSYYADEGFELNHEDSPSTIAYITATDDYDNIKVPVNAIAIDDDPIDLEQHQAPQRHEPLLDCQFCGRHFVSNAKRVVHERIHTGEKPFKCSVCNKPFTFRHSMRRHERNVHKRWSRKRPANSKRPVNLPGVGQNAYRQPEPPRVGTPKAVASSSTPGAKKTPDAGSCQFCSRHFTTIIARKMHERIHVRGQPYLCSFCNQAFRFKYSRERHEMRHRENEKAALPQKSPPKQPATQKSPAKQSVLQKRPVKQSAVPKASGLVPIIAEANLLRYQCRYCGRILPRLQSLKIHLRTHTGERPYKCAHCDMSFTISANRRRHEMRLHPKSEKAKDPKAALPAPIINPKSLRPFQCQYCGEVSHSREGLRHHMRTHTGEQPFKCSQCDQHFSVLANLKRHEHDVHGEPIELDPKPDPKQQNKSPQHQPIKCSYCDSTFTSRRNMLKHERRKHFKLRIQAAAAKMEASSEKQSVPRMRFHCCYCDKGFNHSGNMYKHQRRWHYEQFYNNKKASSNRTLNAPNHQAIRACNRVDPPKELPLPSEKTTEFESPKLSTCMFCNQTFTMRCNMYKHIRRLHAHLCRENDGILPQSKRLKMEKAKQEVGVDEQFPFQCSSCDQMFQFREAMLQHEKSMHSKPLLRDVEALAPLPQTKAESKLTCRHCHQTYSSQSSLRRHVKRRHPNGESQKSSNTERLSTIMHSSVMHASYDCPYCQEVFPRVWNWKRHLKQQHLNYVQDEVSEPLESAAELYKCSFCKETFKCNLNRKAHEIREHMTVLMERAIQLVNLSDGQQDKLLTCSFCPATFKSESAITQHRQLTHTANQEEDVQEIANADDVERDNESICDDDLFNSGSLKRRRHSIDIGPKSTNDVPIDDSVVEVAKRRQSDGILSKSTNNKSFENIKAATSSRRHSAGILSKPTSDEVTKAEVSESTNQGLAVRAFSYESIFKPPNQKNTRKGDPIVTDEHTFDATAVDDKLSIEENLKSPNQKPVSCSRASHKSPKTSSPSHFCRFCGLKQRTPHALATHERTHTGERPFSCPLCSKTFVQRFTMNRHKREVHYKERNRSHHCKVCDVSLTSLKELRKHKCAPKEVEETFPCDLCGKFFSTYGQLGQHKAAAHKPEKREPNQFKCDRCNKIFSSKANMKRHFSAVHRSQGDEQSSQQTHEDELLSYETAFQKLLWQIEESSQNGDEGFACSICSKVFPVASNLKRHFSVLHKPRWRSEQIPQQPQQDEHDNGGVHKQQLREQDEQLTQQPPLPPQQPQLSQQSDEPFACNICTKVFASFGQLSRHKGAKHKDLREYVSAPNTGPPPSCTFCGQQFPDRYELEVHLQEHTGSRPYGCSICGKRYSCSQLLQRHKRDLHRKLKRPVIGVRTEHRLFQCRQCCLSFRSQFHLRRHSLSHSRPTGTRKCDVCGACFAAKSSFYKHKKLHQTDS